MWLDLQKPAKLLQELKSNSWLNIVSSYTHLRNTHTHQSHTYVGIDSQVCFHRANPVNPRGCTIRPVESLWSFNKDAWVPNCCQQLSWPTLWTVSVFTTCWRHSTAVCVPMEGTAHLWLPTLPLHPFRSPTLLYVHATCDIIAVAKKVANNPAVLARWMD